jgi:type IV pilus assembly protein PilC
MLAFDYTARDNATNKIVKATVQAESERAAAKLLIGQNMVPLEIIEQGKKQGILSKLQNRVGTKDRVVYIRQLATLINAGLPLAQSLHTVQEQTSNKRLAAISQDIITSVEGGSSLADAFGKHRDVFDDLFVALVAAGEASGTLDKALERIADQQENDAELMGKVKGALVYPAIVLGVIMIVIIYMLVIVVPQIEQLYADMNATLPFITLAMVASANFLITFWWLVLILIGAGIYFGKRWLETDSGRRWSDTFKLNVPMFGGMFRKLYMARFTRTGQTLLSTGVPMLEMMKISASSVGNVVVAEDIRKASEKVRGGKSLSSSLKSSDYVLPLVPQMISIGEQSGGIDAMMGKAASFYENELDNTIRSISTAIEPILMVVLALVAGVMVAAILLPVYGLVGSGGVGIR